PTSVNEQNSDRSLRSVCSAPAFRLSKSIWFVGSLAFAILEHLRGNLAFFEGVAAYRCTLRTWRIQNSAPGKAGITQTSWSSAGQLRAFLRRRRSRAVDGAFAFSNPNRSGSRRPELSSSPTIFELSWVRLPRRVLSTKSAGSNYSPT